MQVQLYNHHEMPFNQTWLEQVLLQIGDVFDIRIVWDRETAVFSSVLAVAGGIVGGLAGGRVGAALGAGLGGAAGLGVSTVVSLREIWTTVKEKLQELLYIVFNFLRRLDPIDYARAFEILMACAHSRKQLVLNIIGFIVEKLDDPTFKSLCSSAPQVSCTQCRGQSLCFIGGGPAKTTVSYACALSAGTYRTTSHHIYVI